MGPELLEVRAAPGGMLGGMMLGAVWFGSEDEDDTDRTMRSGSYDPLWGLGHAAYLSHQAFEASASAARPELHLSQFSVGFTTRLPEGRGPGSPSPAQLEAADGIARDMIIHSVDTLSRGSIDRFDWIDDLSIFEDLVTAIASQDMKVMRAGFVPWGVNPSSSGQSGFTSGSVAWGSSSGATVGGVTSDDSGGITARPHGDIQPLRLPPPQYGNANVPGDSQTVDPQLVAMSGGSGGSGGGDPPVAVDDYYSGLHDVGMTVADNGVLWNDYLGSEPGVPSLVSSPSHDPSFSFSQGGGFTYTPPANWAGNDSFTYTITNSVGTSQPATVTIAITNNAPVAGAETYSAFVNTELVIPSSRWPGVEGVLANDADADGDEFTVSSHSYPQHGAVAIELDGSFVYMPGTDYEGPDSFEYTISDGIVDSAAQVVEVNVYRPFVDLDTDSDNTGLIEGTQVEDDIEMAFPGKILVRNTDDDNGNLVQDLAEAPLANIFGLVQDDDLFPIEIAVEATTPQMDGFTLEISHDATLKLWNERSKNTAASATYIIGTNTIPTTLYVEGYDIGTGQVQCILKNNAGTVVNQDSVQFLVVEMDIDTDSDNDTEVDRTISEDLIECLVGDDIGEVGKRIFTNVDDDNKNGRADRLDSEDDYDLHGLHDKDFAEVKLSAYGVSALEGYSLWLGLPPSLKAWRDKDKSSLTFDDYDIDLGTPGSGDGPEAWYIWYIGPNGPANFPETLYFEGVAEGRSDIDWRLVKPNGSGFDASGDILAQDKIEINAEPIVWPNQDPSVSWDPNEPTGEWNGFALAEGWFIENSLGDIINGSTGYIRTQYPQKVDYPNEDPDFRWEGTIAQKTNATLDLAELCVTSDWGDDIWMKIEVEYEFKQSPNIPVGQFVDTNLPDRWQASFHHNSGVIFENRAEIQIFDTESLLTAIEGTNITLDGSVVSVEGDPTQINGTEVPPNSSIRVHLTRVNGGGSDSQARTADEIHALISGIPYGYENLDYELNETNMDRLGRAPKGGRTMTIYVRKHLGDYEFRVTISDHSEDVQYSVPISGDSDPNALYLQSHWGSGVKFKTAKVAREDPPPTS